MAVVYLLLSLFLRCAVCLDNSYNVTVALDGSGDYDTVSAAVKNAPSNSIVPYTIHIKQGIYHENTIVTIDKANLAFIGDGAHRTKITANRSNAKMFSTYNSATVAVKADGFVAKFLTFENSAGPSEGQAVAFRNEGNLTAVYQCVFLGYQDTLYAKSNIQFYRECDIHGTVDFILGSALAVFQNCNLYARDPNHEITLTAQSNSGSTPGSGYVFQNCSLTLSPGLQKEVKNTYLGRPWAAFSTVIVMESWLDDIVRPEGWVKWEVSLTNITYREYNNRGPGSDTRGRVNWPSFKVSYNSSEAIPYTVSVILKGDEWLPQTNIPYYGGLALV